MLARPWNWSLSAALVLSSAVGADATAEPEPFGLTYSERVLLLDHDHGYRVTLRLHPDRSFGIYVSRTRRDVPSGPRQFSDVPVFVPERYGHLCGFWVLGDRIYAVAPVSLFFSPAREYRYYLSDYPLFDANRQITVAVWDGQKNERSETVHLTRDEKRDGIEMIKDAMRKGQTADKLFGGRSREVLDDGALYNLVSGRRGVETETLALACVPRNQDAGAMAVLAKSGQVFFLRYRFEDNIRAVWKDHLEEVARIDPTDSEIYLTADDRIILPAREGLVQFARSGDAWNKSVLRERFKVIGRIWDRTKDEDIFLGSREDGLFVVGPLDPGRSVEPAPVEARRADELRALWDATRRPAARPTVHQAR